jgi:ribonuclease R
MGRRSRKGRRVAKQVSVGVIHVARKGYGFADTPEGEYFILRGYLHGAMDGDLVEVVRLRSLEARRRQQMRKPSAQILRNSKGEGEREMLGSVRRVLERAHETLVGTLYYENGLGVVTPHNECIPYDIFLDPRVPGAKTAEEGDIVVVRLTQYPSKIEAAQGSIEEVIGREDERGIDIEVIIHDHKFETQFSAAALEEAATLAASSQACHSERSEEPSVTLTTPPNPRHPERSEGPSVTLESDQDVAVPTHTPMLSRRDLRNRFVFTIDPADAKDFDDALSVDYIDGQLRLGVHIADVSAYVAWDSALDLDARRRATSVYLPDRVIPMLPHQISDELCSLRPNEDKLAFTVDMLMNTDGSVAETDFYPSLIRSSARLTYDEAQSALSRHSERSEEPSVTLESGQDVAVQSSSPVILRTATSRSINSVAESSPTPHREAIPESSLSEKLHTLDKLAKKLARRRRQRGAIDFEGVEAKVALDEDGSPTAVHLRTKTAATSLVEEAMILANEQVAEYMLANAAPMVYRIHDEPLLATLDELLPTLQEFGYAQQGSPQTSQDIQALLEASADKPEHHLISSLLLRAMKRARYASNYTTHFGLASKGYTHFTSPIRRYPDLMVHRLLKSQLAGEPLAETMEKQLAWICEHSSEMEREAERASFEATALKLCEFLAPRIGERFSGIITGVNTAGFYVREDMTTAEGFVPRETLPPDFEYDQARFRYHNTEANKSYRLGQPVSVTLKDADLIHARLQFVIA